MNKVNINDAWRAPETKLDIDLIDFYTDDNLWEKTNCPFGTQYLTKEVYDDVNLGELLTNELLDELNARNIKFLENKGLFVDMQWENEEDPSEHYLGCIMYSYQGYTYLIKTMNIGSCSGYTMSREPELNKRVT